MIFYSKTCVFAKIKNPFAINIFMAYKYNDSENFRAKLFLTLGIVLTVPFLMLIVEKLILGSGFVEWSIAIVLLALGISSILNSYNIMINKDEKKSE